MISEWLMLAQVQLVKKYSKNKKSVFFGPSNVLDIQLNVSALNSLPNMIKCFSSKKRENQFNAFNFVFYFLPSSIEELKKEWTRKKSILIIYDRN